MEKKQLMKYVALFSVFLIAGAIAVAAVSTVRNNGGNNGIDNGVDNGIIITNYSFENVSGTHLDFTYDDARDAVQYLPQGVSRIDIVKLRGGDPVSDYFSNTFSETGAEKVLIAGYESGAVEYYTLKNNSNATFRIPEGTPRYEEYNGYHLVVTDASQRLIIGNPFAVLTLYANDSKLGKNVTDTLSGKAMGSDDFDDILGYADDSEYDEIMLLKAAATGNYEKYYQRYTVFPNGSLQMESVILDPGQELKDKINEFAAVNDKNITLSVAENGSVMKIYIDSTDENDFKMGRGDVYAIVLTGKTFMEFINDYEMQENRLNFSFAKS